MQTGARGGCLTVWLLLMLAANAFTIISNIINLQTYQQFYPNASPFFFILLAGFGVVNLLSVYALWTWKRWGFYLFVASALVVLGINLVIGIPIFIALFGLLGVAILWLLLRSRWPAFA